MSVRNACVSNLFDEVWIVPNSSIFLTRLHVMLWQQTNTTTLHVRQKWACFNFFQSVTIMVNVMVQEVFPAIAVTKAPMGLPMFSPD